MAFLDGDPLTDMDPAGTLAAEGHNTRHSEANGALREIRTWIGDVPGTYIQGSTVFKTADETVNNSATAQDDDELTFSIAANETVRARFVIVYSATTSADVAISFSVPSGAAGTVSMDALAPSVTSTDGLIRKVTGGFGTNRLGGAGAGTKISAVLDMLIRNGATAGSVTFRWAQFTAEVSDAVVYADSHIVHQKVS